MDIIEAKKILEINNVLNSMEILAKFERQIRDKKNSNIIFEAKKVLFHNLLLHYKKQKKKFRPKSSTLSLCNKCGGIGEVSFSLDFINEDCKRCNGIGKVDEEKCSTCRGKGFIKKPIEVINSEICPECNGLSFQSDNTLITEDIAKMIKNKFKL